MIWAGDLRTTRSLGVSTVDPLTSLPTLWVQKWLQEITTLSTMVSSTYTRSMYVLHEVQEQYREKNRLKKECRVMKKKMNLLLLTSIHPPYLILPTILLPFTLPILSYPQFFFHSPSLSNLTHNSSSIHPPYLILPTILLPFTLPI